MYYCSLLSFSQQDDFFLTISSISLVNFRSLFVIGPKGIWSVFPIKVIIARFFSTSRFFSYHFKTFRINFWLLSVIVPKGTWSASPWNILLLASLFFSASQFLSNYFQSFPCLIHVAFLNRAKGFMKCLPHQRHYCSLFSFSQQVVSFLWFPILWLSYFNFSTNVL